jgi:hypothetical protein
MGQVWLARIAKDHLPDGGSITLTTGILAMQPMPGSASISMVNAGLEGFVRAAALQMPRNSRINAVSPPWVKETMVKLGMDPTSNQLSCPACDLAPDFRGGLDDQSQLRRLLILGEDIAFLGRGGAAFRQTEPVEVGEPRRSMAITRSLDRCAKRAGRSTQAGRAYLATRGGSKSSASSFATSGVGASGRCILLCTPPSRSRE